MNVNSGIYLRYSVYNRIKKSLLARVHLACSEHSDVYPIFSIAREDRTPRSDAVHKRDSWDAWHSLGYVTIRNAETEILRNARECWYN